MQEKTSLIPAALHVQSTRSLRELQKLFLLENRIRSDRKSCIRVVKRNVTTIEFAAPELEFPRVASDLVDGEPGAIAQHLHAFPRVEEQVSWCVELDPIHAVNTPGFAIHNRDPDQHTSIRCEQPACAA